MALQRWKPRLDYTKQEQRLLTRLRKTRKLFAFLRDHRQELFDDAFQAELESMYRSTGAGKDPTPPALLAMVVILQSYQGISDAEAVDLTVMDLRWQMVLDRLGADEPAFGQGTLVDFRERLIRADLDLRLLERTVELARRTNAFDWKKLPKTLRVAVDSSPLVGAGRVEDTVNLLAHAARKVVQCAADLLGWSAERVAREAGMPLLLGSSVKRGLDIEWSNPEAKAGALNTLVEQLDSLDAWLRKRLPEALNEPPLKEHVETLVQIRTQDLEPDPEGGGGGTRIRRGVAPERRVSIEDPDMRHGRKSRTKLFNGYKRHIATDLDTDLIIACAMTPANRPEEEAAPVLKADIERQGRAIWELYIDRGYIASSVVAEILAYGGQVICKPWVPRNGSLFTKADFKINMRAMTITCPAGQVEPIDLGADIEFNPEACASCPQRTNCTTAAPGSGRTVSIADDERLQHRLRKLVSTPQGRERLRERVAVEHRLAHLGRRQGNRARYCGTRKNLFDLRRAAAVQNLEVIDRRLVANVQLRKAA
jgi:DDE family transposase/transposase-like protein DUF772